uniref:FAR1 domain-containing protein n=1 Tax=Aegilops tauschii subsp. strangulata TaxID=200361 RepID=A0A453AC00_AEGTS
MAEMVCEGVLTDAQGGAQHRRDESLTRSGQSTGRVNPEASGWTKRLHLGSAPPDHVPCPLRMSALELSIRKYAEQPDKSVVRPELGLSFDSLGEAYDFYNLYSWEVGFGIRYGKSRLNAKRTKSMQEIVCGCSGKPDAENSRSCMCECPAPIRLLRASDNSWYIIEHRASHNHSMSLTMGEKVHWPSHKHIDVYTKDLIRQLRENNVNLGKFLPKKTAR